MPPFPRCHAPFSHLKGVCLLLALCLVHYTTFLLRQSVRAVAIASDQKQSADSPHAPGAGDAASTPAITMNTTTSIGASASCSSSVNCRPKFEMVTFINDKAIKFW